MGVTSERLVELGIVDQTIAEPLGGAHRDEAATAANIKAALIEQLDKLQAMDLDELVARRYQRLMSYGISN
jgi:acetyl-CoA carboxylase carboxyl transferase subunit alpha